MLRILEGDEKGTHLMRTLGGTQRVSTISESGFYHVALRSHIPKAKPFRRWVTHEVLPQIRRTGSYVPLRDGATGELLDKLAMMDRTRQLLQNTLDERDRQLSLCNRRLCALGIQYRRSGQYLLYAAYARRGFAANRTYLRPSSRLHRLRTITRFREQAPPLRISFRGQRQIPGSGEIFVVVARPNDKYFS